MNFPSLLLSKNRALAYVSLYLLEEESENALASCDELFSEIKEPVDDH